MSRLNLALLGAPLVQHGDRVITLPTRKALALLVFLAVEDRAHSRDKITALFWGESDAKQGRASLRGTLAYIRDALRQDSATIDAPSHLLTDRESLRFNSESDHELDIAALDFAARMADLPGQSEKPEQRIKLLESVVERLRGEFLEGFSLSDAPEFDDWVSLEREIWHQKVSRVFDRLSQLQFDGGELMRARETTTRWIAQDMLNEAAHRRLMLVQLALGERADALHTYDAYVALLARELNAEPTPETRAIAERARTETFGGDESVSRDVDRPLSRDASLVGRSAEHLQLVGALRAARRGRTQFVLVEGEPGIGKTRLAKEFLAWATAHGADVLRGRAYETALQLPYQSLAAALRERLLRQDNLEALLTRTWWAELRRLLPELDDRLHVLPAPVAMNEAEARVRLFEAVTRLVGELAAGRPTVLFIDDLPWADSASLDLLNYAARRWSDAGTRLVLLFTARSEDLVRVQAPGQTLEQWLIAVAHDASFERIALGPLDRDATGQLIHAFGFESESPLVQKFSEQVFTETRGQPFFIVETLKSLAERGLVQSNESGNWELKWGGGQQTLTANDIFLPTTIRDLIRTRVAHLSPHARVICNAGSVLGDGFQFSQVKRVAELGPDESLAGLEEGLRRGLLRETGEHYLFAHDKIRETVYTDLSSARRRELHRRALDVLGQDSAPALQRVRHALAAGAETRTADLFIAAGDEAMQVFAVRYAIAHYEQAVSSGANDLELWVKVGRAYELANEWERARAAYQELLSRARLQSDASTETMALNRLATVLAQGFFDLRGALALLQQALDAASRSGNQTRRAETEWSLSQIFFYVWELDRAREHAIHALDLARSLGNTELAARSLNILGYIGAVSYDTLARVEAQEQEARLLFMELGNRVMEVECLAIITNARLFGGYPQAALVSGTEGLALAREIENPWGQANCSYTMAFALIELGRYRDALELALSGVHAARSAGHPPILVFNLSALGRAYRALGDLSSARAADLEAHAIGEGLHHPFVTELTAIDLCADYGLAGEWETALGFARAALLVRKYDRLYPGFTRWLETEAFIRAGDLQSARADLEHFGEHLNGNLRMQLQFERALGLLEQTRSNLASAAGHLIAARDIATELGLVVESGEIARLVSAVSSHS